MVKRVYLIGFMGTGKSTIGKNLAARLGFLFLDTDQLLETRAGMPIPKIFETFGESYFRDLESKVLTEIEQDTNQAVISTGGGIVLREYNRTLLQNGQKERLVVQLTAKMTTLVTRLRQDRTRPLLQTKDLQARITQLQEERKGLYDFADITIATDMLSEEEIIEQIIHTLTLR